jgi:hypothetical protein
MPNDINTHLINQSLGRFGAYLHLLWATEPIFFGLNLTGIAFFVFRVKAARGMSGRERGMGVGGMGVEGIR